MVRGIERRRIFLGDVDRRDFVERLDRLLLEEQWRCFAWALMPNHVHLVLQGAHGGLSRLMARLNTGYARSFNLRHTRVGYLFQNRFKSRLVKDDRDLMGLVLYVHRNPLAAGLVDSLAELERDPWCGYGALLGVRPARSFESVPAALALFAEHSEEARRRIRARMIDPTPSFDDRADDSHGDVSHARTRPAPAAANASDRARSVAPSGKTRRIEIWADQDAAEQLHSLAREVSRWLGVPVAEICSATVRRGPARARAAIAYLAVMELGIPGRVTAEVLGISPSAVSHALRRGKAITEKARLYTVRKPNRQRK
jgi:REP element-mobilizing transposase RayT